MSTVAAHPVRVEGKLDVPLSRWLWLVKWLLAIPHFIILVFLFVAFFLLTIVAFFAILITGRYPRSLFDFNLGVLRWGWRVVFYTYAALGTDRYPPFTLDAAPEYPATLEVAYPEQLSRGLVLVKWWLLAIPHYLVIAILLGGGGWYAQSRWTTTGTSGGRAAGRASSCCSSSLRVLRSCSRRAIREGSSTSCLGSTVGCSESSPTRR